MGPSLATVRAMATDAIAPNRKRSFRLLHFDQHAAWHEFCRWYERDPAAPQIMSYRVQARQQQRKPSQEDRLIWAIDMGRSFEQLAPAHRAILMLLASGQSLAVRAHQMRTSVRTLLRRRDAALQQLAAIREKYHDA